MKHESSGTKNEEKDIAKIVEKALLPTSPIFQDTTNQLPLNLTQFIDFIISSYNNPNIYEEAYKINKDVTKISEMIEKAYPYVESRRIKSKLTRLKNKLNSKFTEDMDTDNAETETDYEDSQAESDE